MKLISTLALTAATVIIVGSFLNLGAPPAPVAPAASTGTTTGTTTNLATDITAPAGVTAPASAVPADHSQFQAAVRDLAIRAGKATLTIGEQLVIAIDGMAKSSDPTK